VETATPAAAELLSGLSPDGVAYLRLPARARPALARAAGLRLGPAVLEVGGLLVPMERDAVRWALRSRTASVRGRLARLAPAKALELVAPGAIATRPGARPLGAWLHARGSGSSVVAAPRTAFLVGADGPVVVAKLGSGLPARPDLGEGRALAELGPAARAAGADLPVALEESELGGEPLLVTTGIAGTPASMLIAALPRRRGALVERLAAWLERWNTATSTDAVLSRDLLERDVLAPARGLGLPPGYVAALERLCETVAGRPAKLVAVHNDLTTANILAGRGTRLGILDWETAERSALPLGDLLYAVADAEAAADGFADRPGAFLAACGSDRRAFETRVCARLGLDDEVADLCFHACWLRHAANESLRPVEGGRPFLAIVRTIAERRIRVEG
jgi:hypothetical protein